MYIRGINGFPFFTSEMLMCLIVNRTNTIPLISVSDKGKARRPDQRTLPKLTGDNFPIKVPVVATYHSGARPVKKRLWLDEVWEPTPGTVSGYMRIY
jgi:hypothetical protein